MAENLHSWEPYLRLTLEAATRKDWVLSKAWDRYALSHPHGTHGHLYGWKRVIEEAYALKAHYLSVRCPDNDGTLTGILPLIQMKHPLRGIRLLSMPFLDTGGILADSPDLEEQLLNKALGLAHTLNAGSLELRQTTPLAGFNEGGPYPGHTILTHKVSLTLALPGSAEALKNAFKSKLRSQIRKAEKNGLQTEVGGESLLGEFYDVFARNMRDLGSPVHPRTWFEKVLEHFRDNARIMVARQGRTPLAVAFTLRFGNTLVNPWASSLKESRHLASNMLLYWAMLEYACKNGFQTFDFGRSTAGAGTCRFKQQWGAKASPLFWHTFTLNGKPPPTETLSFSLWKHLPVPVATLLGPLIRKHIGL